MTDLTSVILQVRERYLEKTLSYYQINNGLCEDFATDVCAQLGNPKDIYALCNENFMCDNNDMWDWGLLSTHWHIFPPQGLSAQETDDIEFGGHMFLVHDQKFYDAECPQGVSSFFELPIFHRCVVAAVNKKGGGLNNPVCEQTLQSPKSYKI